MEFVTAYQLYFNPELIFKKFQVVDRNQNDNQMNYNENLIFPILVMALDNMFLFLRWYWFQLFL